jgi:hypothetical protein
MSEIYPSVRTSIRNSVLQALYERPGAWLSTHDLLGLVEEAESSGILARILSDMAATGRLAKGPKTQNANGQACNTWGLSPEWRGRLAVDHTWQDHTGQAATEAPPLPVESREDEAPANVPETPEAPETSNPAAGICDFAALQPPFTWMLAEPDQPIETPQTPLHRLATMDLGHWEKWLANQPQMAALNAQSDHPPETPQPIHAPYAPISAPGQPRPDWDIAAVIADYSDHKPLPPTAQEAATDIHIHCHPLPERWLPELRLRLLATDGGGDPIITLRINTDGGGAFLTLSTRGKIAFDPGELDFLPSIGTALCQFVDALYPYGTTRPTAAATTPPAHRKPSHESLHP